MQTLAERLHAWYRSALSRLKQRRWKTWAAVVTTVYVMLATISSRVSDAGMLALEYAFSGLRHLAQQPMGLGGLGVLTFAVVLAIASSIETRPRREPVALEEPKPLDDAERRLVQDLRTVWNRFGVSAIDQLGRILKESQGELRQREYWAELLEPVTIALDLSRAAFETALEPSLCVGIDQVREKFNAMYAAYIRTMKWVAVLQSKGQLALGSRPEERMAVWRLNHRDMVDRLRDLNEDPAHSRTLHIYLNFVSDPAFREFVLEAEMSPEWLSLIRESQDPSPEA